MRTRRDYSTAYPALRCRPAVKTGAFQKLVGSLPLMMMFLPSKAM
jgi:hypothetical protein